MGCTRPAAVATPPATAAIAKSARCPILTPAAQTEALLREPGIAGALTGGAALIAAGGGAMLVDDSGSAKALGTVGLGVGVAALTAAGIVALYREPPCSSDGHAAVDHQRVTGHE